MNKLLTIILYFLLGINFVNAQNKYDKLWLRVENLELEGKFTDANSLVDKILIKAEKSKKSEHIIKGFIYKSKFTLLLKEDAQSTIINNLRLAIEKYPFPCNAILNSLYAENLEQYLNRNIYKIRKRTKLSSNNLSDNFLEWDISNFNYNIAKHYEKSLLQAAKLKKIKIDNFQIILTQGINNKNTRPSLYDFLAHRAIYFYKKNNLYSPETNKSLYIANEKIFTDTFSFIKENFEADTITYSLAKSLSLYQKLESFHISTNTTAYIDVILSRLKLSRKISILKNKDELFLARLKKLANKYDKEHSAIIDYNIAKHYYAKSNSMEAKHHEVYKNYRIKAVEICNKVLLSYPDSNEGILCDILKNEIEKKAISIKTNNYISPNKAILTHITFCNTDSVYISAYPIASKFILKGYKYNRDSILLAIIDKQKPIISKLCKLPKKNDHYTYTTELDFPSLNIGKYVLISSTKKDITSIDQIYNYADITISNLSIIQINRQNNLTIKILDRENGTPIQSANIQIKKPKGNTTTGKTDKNGEFIIKKNKNNHPFSIRASIANDTIFGMNNYINAYYKKNNIKKHKIKMFIYLDRSIYRPGQKLHFKGLMLENKDGKSSVVANTFASIDFINANKEIIHTFKLKTNQFGSISGVYTLPKAGLTGRFSISMHTATKSKGLSKYNNYGFGHNRAIEFFSVEEYKRPKFEVKFEEIKGNYRLGDSIKIKGLAKAFMGANLSAANVRYSVSREKEIIWGRDIYGDNEQIIQDGQLKTDPKGEFTLKLIAIPDSSISKKDKAIFIYKIKADVTDINGETQSNTISLRVAYHNLELTCDIASKINANITPKIEINTKNLNNQHIDAHILLTIKKLKSPQRILRTKKWDLVELPSLNKEDFVKLFPHEPYNKADIRKTWHRGKKVFEANINSSGNKKIALNNISNWESGAYNIQIMAIDNYNDTIIQNKQFVVFRNRDKYLSDKQMFDYEIINTDFKKDKNVKIKLKTACNNLKVNLEAYYKNEVVYTKIVELKKGTLIVKIPVDDNYKNKLDLSLYFVKYNSLHTKTFSAKFLAPNTNLEIETLSFRNKLTPGNKETWSFRITNSDKSNANAELLASMYDASLNQFKNHSWTTNIDIKNYTYSYSPQAKSDFFRLKNFTNFNYRYNYRPISQEIEYKRMRNFGFNLGNNIYTNRKYLNKLMKAKKASSKGNINGYIVDRFGNPIPGASIIIEGTSIGTTSDQDGFYSIKTKKGSQLKFLFIGYQNKNIAINKIGTYNIILSESNSSMSEVIVTAYGASPQRSFSLNEQLQSQVSGISIMDEEECEDDLEIEMQGNISIRGSSSLKNSTNQLYIVDGKIVSTYIKNSISSKDIIDIKIIEGSTAIAIYGSKAKNGVIIITTKKSLESLSQVQARENLNETAFFFPHLNTNKKGEVIFSFDSPQALTRWKLMLFAHNKSTEHAYIQKMAYTQKNISVIPNVPRFFREGDTINITSKIVNLSKKTQNGIAALQLLDAVRMTPIDYIISMKASKTFTITAKGNTLLRWKVKIPKGISAIKYKIIAKAGKHSDGETNIIPVLTNRTLITEAKPIWLAAHKSKKIVFTKLKQGVSPSLKNHNFTIEYTSNPAWMAIKSLPYLMEFPYECAEQTFSRFYANALAESIITANPKIEKVFEKWRTNKSLKSPLETNAKLKSVLIEESPWLRDLESDKKQKANIANLFDRKKISNKQKSAINKLKDMQLSSGAFPWFSGGGANIFITQHIISGIGHLQKLNIKIGTNKLLKPLLNKAIEYLDNQFVKNHAKINKIHKTEINLNHQIIHYLYSRSFFLKEYPLKTKNAKIINLYLEECKRTWITQSLYDKTLIALCLHRNNYKKTSENIIEALSQQSIINQEKGMFWKENKPAYYWYQSPIETQALLIEAYAEINGNKKHLEAMKQWLMMNKQTKHWGSTKATTEAIYALLMHGKDYTSIKSKAIIKLNNKNINAKKLLSVNTEAQTGYIKLNWKQKEIIPSMGEIKIINKSDIIGFGAAYWQYFEDMDKVKNSKDSPLSIQKNMYILEIKNKKEILTPISKNRTIEIGDLIKVRLIIKTKHELEFVHLKDLRASGLEPISVLSEYKWQDGLGYYQSTKDVATHFFFDKLPKGTYVFEYKLRANNSGNFSNGISSIQSMYAPQFVGNSEANRLIIKE